MNINNISTIATLIAGLLAPILVKTFGLNIEGSTLAGIIVLIIAYISARNPNTMAALGNAVNQTKQVTDELQNITTDDVEEIAEEVIEDVISEEAEA